MRKLVCLLIITSLLCMIFATNSAMASKDSAKAHFRVVSVGRCLVQYDAFFYVPPHPEPDPNDYSEWESPVGSFIFDGQASTEDWYGGPPGDPFTPPGEWEGILPGTMKASGFLKVSWSHEGVDYEIQGRICPTSQTYGLLEPEKDWLSIKGSAGAMDFIGTYKVGALTAPLQCACTFIVGPDGLNPDCDVLLVRIQFPGWPTSVTTFYWFEAGLEYQDMYVPAALVLEHKVSIK